MYYIFQSNVLNVIVLSVIGIWINLSLNKKATPYFLGIIFGLITVSVITHGIMIDSRIYDFRLITMTMAGFIGGPITAAIAAIISSIYHYNVSVPDSMGGILSIIVFGCFGSVLGKQKQKGIKVLFWFIIGIVMSCIFLIVIAITNRWDGSPANLFRLVSFPYLLLFPIATTIIVNFYFWIYEFFSKALFLNTILNTSPINLMIFSDSEPILFSKHLENYPQFDPYIQNPSLLLTPEQPDLYTPNPQYKEIITENGIEFITNLSHFQMHSGADAYVAIVNDVTERRREQSELRSATDLFGKVFQLGPHMMAIFRKSDYRCLDVNDRYLIIRNFTREDIIGKTPMEIGILEDEFKKLEELISVHGSVQNFECSLVTKYGITGTVILSAETIQLEDEECILIAYNDVTEMKQMQKERIEQLERYLSLEAELSQKNQLIADIITNMPDPFYVLDKQWRFRFVNKKAEMLFTKTREELLGKVIWEINPQSQGCICHRNFQKSINNLLPITFETCCLLNNYQWNQVIAYPSAFGLSIYYRDITEQKSAQNDLAKSQKEMNTILESMTDCFFALDNNFRFTYVNEAGEKAFRKSRDELLGMKITEVYKVNKTALIHYQEVINEKKSVTFEFLSEALGNKWLEMSTYPTETGMTCYFRDITSRKIAEETLRQSEEKFSKVFHGGPIMMALATVEGGEYLDVNEALCTGTGYAREEFIGHTSKDLNFFVDMIKGQEVWTTLIAQGRIDNAEVDFRMKSGEIRHGLSWSQLFFLDGRHCHITGLIDVTEQKQLQEEMAKVDRLNLVGQLAAGIAHEIRNPMTTVRGYLQLLGTKPDNSTNKSTFELMISELDRANSIITEFLSLAQTKHAKLRLQNLNDILTNLYPLLEADTFTQNKQIQLNVRDIPDLDLNAKEINQLILNIARNGLEAMDEGGCLTIESYLQDDKVVLAIKDEGCGITPENKNKLGTPFFTTKDHGTGLGLAICYKIVESHNAKIDVYSKPKSTAFYITFPIPNKEQNKSIA